MSIAEQTPANAPQIDATEVDSEEAARARKAQINRIAKWTLPSLVMVLSVLAWHLYVTLGEIPHYI
ncbi:MAG: ABC transporter permease, partial [Pseudomonadota bacterium]